MPSKFNMMNQQKKAKKKFENEFTTYKGYHRLFLEGTIINIAHDLKQKSAKGR